MKILLEYLKDNMKTISIFIVFTLVFFAMFFLCDLPIDIYFYGMLLCFTIELVVMTVGFLRHKNKHNLLKCLQNEILVSEENLPEPSNAVERDYRSLIAVLRDENANIKGQMYQKLTDMTDYYTMWVHQIKTPISAMRLILQGCGDENTNELSVQLFKIEQYVDMVLAYIRTDSESTDYVFSEYNLDDIVKKSVRKYAPLFIRKKIPVDIHDIDLKIITDEKWLAFVIGQILSNAVKYSDKGKVSIYTENPDTLVIEDNGRGVAESDLPRVFEKGFTGYNGRADKSASGIGLYLSKQILNRLGHKISITSQLGKGTKVMIDLSQEKVDAVR